MIPALAIYSDAMVTMNNQWINSLPQIISRIMTALSLIISWKWITLDFESLENMLYLKNQNKIMNLQTEGILAQAEILRESENHIKICKHDMRHNLGIIRSLIQDKKTEDALKYIEELDPTMKATEPGHGIGMQSILSIVNKYKASASCTSNNGWFNMTFLFT